MKSSSKEIFRFVITGGVCFLIELISLIFFRDAVGLPTLAATPIAFLISVIFNYILCVRWVFSGADGQRASAKAGFLITSVMGLLLNELLMWLFGVLFGEDTQILTILSFTVTMYMVNKALATLIVMVWNYFTKKLILQRGFFHRKMDPAKSQEDEQDIDPSLKI